MKKLKEIKETILFLDMFLSEKYNRETAILCVPEFEIAVGFDQLNPHHIYDVAEHTEVAINTAFAGCIKNKSIVAMVMFFHDIGKPYCFKEIEVKGGIKRVFHNHSEKSYEIAKKWIKKHFCLGDNAGVEFTKKVLFLVRFHDSHISFFENEKGKKVAAKKWHEWISKKAAEHGLQFTEDLADMYFDVVRCDVTAQSKVQELLDKKLDTLVAIKETKYLEE